MRWRCVRLHLLVRCVMSSVVFERTPPRMRQGIDMCAHVFDVEGDYHLVSLHIVANIRSVDLQNSP